MAKKKDPVFNQRKRRVFRTQISSGEVVFGAVFVALTIGMSWWFLAQRDEFDPSERDISMELMEEGSVVDNLYRTPLQRWSEPGQAGAASAAVVDLGVFPPAILDDGWTAATRIQEFDESNLYEKINGAAPQYFQFGFVRLHFVGLERAAEGLELNIELYDMGAFENALGIFVAQRDKNKTLDELGNAHYYATSIGAIGVINQYYFKLTGNEETSAVTDKALQIVESFSALPGGDAEPPRAFTVFRDVLDIPFEGIGFEKSDVFQFQFARDFWFGTPDITQDFRYYVHKAESDEAARELFDQLVESNLYDYDEVRRTEDSVILNHKFLETQLAMKQLGPWVFGFDGASAELDAEGTLMTLQEAFLSDEEA
jgi:hypothetical protein